MIEFQRNFLTPDLYQKVEYYCYRADYYYGEQDNPQQIPTGLVHDLKLDSEIVGYFPKEKNNIPLYRVYINLFNPGEKPHFHIDGVGYTSLFYLQQLLLNQYPYLLLDHDNQPRQPSTVRNLSVLKLIILQQKYFSSYWTL